ncbi:hypothetical protein GN956_G1646 [Arapaima gigas]
MINTLLVCTLVYVNATCVTTVVSRARRVSTAPFLPVFTDAVGLSLCPGNDRPQCVLSVCVVCPGRAMPQMPMPLLHVTLLLSALPVQLLISRWSGTTVAERRSAVHRLVDTWKDLRKHHLNVTLWTEWVQEWISKVTRHSGAEEHPDPQGESLALEVLMHDNDQGYFGASREVRSPRPPHVLYRVGEVVMEQNNRMVGVIISWDEKLKAPPEWKTKMYPDHEVGALLGDTPHYKVIFSGPGQSSLLIGYFPQTSLRSFSGFQVFPNIPRLDHYFSHFDGERFVMRRWLQDLFPED